MPLSDLLRNVTFLISAHCTHNSELWGTQISAWLRRDQLTKTKEKPDSCWGHPVAFRTPSPTASVILKNLRYGDVGPSGSECQKEMTG